MDTSDTRRRLDQISDAGLFERLAAAVLRDVDPLCRRHAHVGVNAEGRTVPSPLDPGLFMNLRFEGKVGG